MMAGWKTVKLGERFKIRSSKRVLQSEWKTEGVPFYRGREVTILSKSGVVDNELFISEGHFKELSAKYGVPAAGDIILTAIGTIGNAYVVKPNDRFYFKDASVLWITASAENDSNFVNYWIKSDHFKGQLDSGNGATVDTLTLDKLKSIEIPLPPLAEQKRIVALLDEAFAGIDEAKANAEANLENAHALFESRLEDAFTSTDTDWTDASLTDVLEKQPQNGWSPPAANHSESGTPVLTLSSVTGFKFKPDKIKHTSAKVDTSKGYWINNGDLVITRSNTPELVGHVAIVAGIYVPTIYPDLIMRMTPKQSRATTAFLYYQLRTRKLRKLITGRAQGANPTMKKISNEAVRTLPISLPSLVKQDEIVKEIYVIESASQELSSNFNRTLAALSELKASILSQAFAGELTA